MIEANGNRPKTRKKQPKSAPAKGRPISAPAQSYQGKIMNAVKLTADEWEWFKQLARVSPLKRTAPQGIRRRLLELRLMQEGRGGALVATAEGRHVLRLVDTRPRAAWRRRESRPKITNPVPR